MRVALPQSTLDAAQVLIPGLFVVLVTWLGARFALAGKIDVGELVAFYGYAAFLVIPLRTAAEAVDKITRSLRRRPADAGRARRRARDRSSRRVPPPSRPSACRSSIRSRGSSSSRGSLTCIVSSPPEEAAAIADRLGPVRPRRRRRARRRRARASARRDRAPADRRQRGGPRALLGDAAPRARPLGARRRRRGDPFGGRDRERRGRDRRASRGARRRRSTSAAARSRAASASGSCSRARCSPTPEILVLVEPTSAVDAHTEARIAQRLREARAGRTTVIVTTSPLVLDQADRGRASSRTAASSPRAAHRELLRTSARATARR